MHRLSIKYPNNSTHDERLELLQLCKHIINKYNNKIYASNGILIDYTYQVVYINSNDISESLNIVMNKLGNECVLLYYLPGSKLLSYTYIHNSQVKHWMNKHNIPEELYDILALNNITLYGVEFV